MNYKKKIPILLLALLGLALSIKLAFIYYTANYDKYALPSFCSISDFIDCDGAAKSDLAQVFGIPLAYWGIILYLIFIFLTFVDKLKEIKFLKFLEVFKEPRAYIACIGTISFLLSMTLAGFSLFGIKKLCILCVITYFIDLIIALVAADGMFKSIIRDFKTTILDFINGAKQYTKTFIVLLILVTSFISYSGITLNFIPHYKKKQEIMKYAKMKHNPYKAHGNILGNENGNVVVYLYSDYVCPMCYIHNIMLHRIVKEYSNVKVLHYNLPFNKECNPYISFDMHPGACYMSKAALAAKKQGDYWGMSSLLYENKPKSEKELAKLAEELNFNLGKFFSDLYSDEISKELENDIKISLKNKVDGTPTMFINDKKYVGIKNYTKLKEIMEENGAKKK